MTATLGYNVFHEFDFTPNSIEDKMMYIEKQSYGLGAISGNPNDSLLKYLFRLGSGATHEQLPNSLSPLKIVGHLLVTAK